MLRCTLSLALVFVFTCLMAQQQVLVMDRVARTISTLNPAVPGAAPVVLTDQNQLNSYDLEINRSNGRMYWSNGFLHTIMTADIASPDDATVFYSDTLNGIIVVDLSVDSINNRLYWLDAVQAKFFRANLDGTGVEEVPLPALPNPGAVVVSPILGKIFFSDANTLTIYSANLDGSDVDAIVPGGPGFAGRLAVAENLGKLYLTNDAANRIYRVNLDGTGLNVVYEGSGDNRPFGLLVDEAGNKLYWTDYNNGSVYQSALDGSGAGFFAEGAFDLPVGLALYGNAFSALFPSPALEKVTVFPNPAVHTVRLSAPQTPDRVEVTDVWGRLVLQSTETELDVSGLPAGRYVVRAFWGKHTGVGFFNVVR